MSGKFLIFGATGSIGSSLAEQLKSSGHDNIHLVGRNEKEVKDILEVLGQEKLIRKRNCTASAMPGNFHELAMCINSRSCRQFDASNREGHNSTNLNVRK